MIYITIISRKRKDHIWQPNPYALTVSPTKMVHKLFPLTHLVRFKYIHCDHENNSSKINSMATDLFMYLGY